MKKKVVHNMVCESMHLERQLFFNDLHEPFSVTQHTANTYSQEQLDAMTGGAFSAPTSGDRTTRIREWLSTQPEIEQIQEVYKELSSRDKGAAKQLREKLDELKRHKTQEQLLLDWQVKGQAILASQKFHIADALAWQRDAAKVGAPLSKEPLAGLKTQLFDRIKRVEDLEHKSQVQREAAVLMAQRMEVLSTKPWREAFDLKETLSRDVQAWVALRDQIFGDDLWSSVDLKHGPALTNSGQQMQALWDAFNAALDQAQKSSESKEEALPQVPAWSEEIKAQRGVGESSAAATHKPKVDPELKAKATHAVQEVLKVLETEMAEGHGKASASAAHNLRSVLKENARLLDEKLEHKAQAALAAASELEGWQKWRADQLRLELVQKAEALFKKVAVKTDKSTHVTKVIKADPKKKMIVPAEQMPSLEPLASNEALMAGEQLEPSDALPSSDVVPSVPLTLPAEPLQQANAVEAPAADAGKEIVFQKSPEMTWVPVMGGRKMQEALRDLREHWKQVDQGGLPNHALWKRFDQACNRAHKVVEVWVEKVKLESAENKAQRLSLIEELKAWTLVGAQGPEWKSVVRQLHQFSERWRDSGHVSEKIFVELQGLWKEAMKLAHAPLELVQDKSVEQRLSLIEEAKRLGAETQLRIDAVKQLQQRWQQESQSVVLDRKQEQKLWDAFRQPIDEAFERKTKQREQSMAAISAYDAAVISASKALDEAVAKQEAQSIRLAMQALDKLLNEAWTPPNLPSPLPQDADAPQAKGQVLEEALLPAADAPQDAEKTHVETSDQVIEADRPISSEVQEVQEVQAPQEPEPKAPAPKLPAKPVIAVRGDDRPGQKKDAPQATSSKDSRGAKPFGRGKPEAFDRSKKPGFDARQQPTFDAPRGPRLGDQAFRAQRHAFEQAQFALKKLSAMAHGESLTQLLSAWESRDVERMPALKELGPRVQAPDRVAMVQALKAPVNADAALMKTAMLRLEMASELPTPAEHLADRRALQLQLLTKRNDPTPVQTWTKDVAQVLSAPYESNSAQRLQVVLKVLMKKSS
jgi:hypothetical protein